VTRQDSDSRTDWNLIEYEIYCESIMHTILTAISTYNALAGECRQRYGEGPRKIWMRRGPGGSEQRIVEAKVT
jgi:hypothetical protein